MLTRFANRKSSAWIISAAVVLALGGSLAWLQRERIQVWYCVRALASAEAADREGWASRVAGLDRAAVPALLELLRSPHAQACDNAGASLELLLGQWAGSDVRRGQMSRELAQGFGTFTEPGRRVALTLEASLLESSAGDVLSVGLADSTRILTALIRSSESTGQRQALVLAGKVLELTHDERCVDACRELVRSCLRHSDAGTRLEAARLARRPGLALLQELAACLNDPEAEIRREAMVAVGPAPQAIATEELLAWLHDENADVRLLCEKSLRSRGLTHEHLKMGRLISDRNPANRLRVLELLQDATDVEPNVWLRKLSHDSEPALRAAAIRSAVQRRAEELQSRLKQMAENDPSPSVRQLAEHYLRPRKQPAPTEKAR